jgi:hypothetical protein
MKVSELIEALSNLDPDSEVFMGQPSHDYWSSELAVPIDNIRGVQIKWSAYHETNKIVDFNDDGGESVPAWIIE